MRPSSTERLKSRKKSDDSTTVKCETIDTSTEDMVLKSEIIENNEESKHFVTDYEFISVGNVKTETPDYEEFPWGGLEDLDYKSCTENSESVVSLLGSIKTENIEKNYDSCNDQPKEFDMEDDDIEERNVANMEKTSDSNFNRNLKQTSGFPCCYCYTSESTLEKLSLHVSREHYMKQVFVCKICSKVINSAKYFSVHSSRHRVIKCSLCPYKGSSNNLNKHRQSKHSIQQAVGRSLKFKCEDCDMSFVRYFEQLQHEKVVHKKVQPYLTNHLNYFIKGKKRFSS